MSLQPFLEAPWVIKAHVILAMLALLTGTWLVFFSHKGDPAHRSMGTFFLALISVAALLALFIPGRMPIREIGLGPIHLIVPFSFYAVWRAYSAARCGSIAEHRTWIRILYFGLLILVLVMNALVFPGITQTAFFGADSIRSDQAVVETLFKMGSRAAMTAWIALGVALFATRARDVLFLYAGRIMPALLSLVYLVLVAQTALSGQSEQAGFGSLTAVKALLCGDLGMTAAWHHFLAFDLFVGTWIARDGLDRSTSQFALIPILILTFLVGPVGLLFYLAFRTFRRLGGNTANPPT